jgi:DNA replication protein DnaC
MLGNTGEFSISAQCEVFRLSRSGYYAWRHRRQNPSNRQLEREKLDRLTHHVNILEMNGDSYRLKDSKRNKAKN